MKPKFNRLLAASITSVLALSSSAFAADRTKADNTTNLDLAGSWDTLPGALDVAVWNGAYSIAGSLSAGFTASTPVSWQGIRIGALSGTAAGLVSIGGTGTVVGSQIAIGSAGIDMSAANQNAVVNAATVVLGSSQTWDVASGRNLRFGTTGTGAANSKITGGSGVVISVQGSGVVDLNQGTGTGNGLSGYGGKWIVGSGATLRGLRNNTEAFGTNTAADSITLSGGTLAVGGITGVQGNWSWSNNITLTSATNSTISAQNPDATARTLDFTGAIIGSGNLTFSKTQSGAHTFQMKNFGTTTGGVRTNIMGSGAITVSSVTLRLEPQGAGAGLSFTHNNNITLNGGTLHSYDGIQTFAGTMALTGANTITSNFSGKNVFLNGVISTSGTAGILTLTPGQSANDNTITINGNNDYTSGTTLGDNTANKGIVVAGHNNAFGTGAVNIRGAQLRAGSAGIILGNVFNVGAGGFRLGGTNAFTLSGTTNIDAASRTIANYGSATVTLGAISTVASSVAAFDNAAGAGSGAQIIVNGNITGAGAVSVSAGNTAFNGINSHTGATTISGGNISGTGSFTGAGGVTMSGGSIRLAGGATTTSLTLSGGVTFTNTPTVTFAVNPIASTVYDVFTYGAGSVTGGNLLTAAWRGVLSNDTANQKYIFTAGASTSLTWNTTSGTWDNIGTNANWTGSDTKFYDGDSVTFGNIAADSTITLSGNLAPSAVNVTNDANTYTFTGGAITGSTGLVKSGNGNLVISTANTFSGNVNVNGGTIKIGNKNAFGAFQAGRPVAQVVVASGAAVDFNGVTDATYGYTIAGAGVGGTGALTNSGAAIGNGSAQTSNIKLSANASIGGVGNWSLLTNGYAATSLDLNSFTLTKTGANTIALVNTTTTAGNVQISTGTLALGVAENVNGVTGSTSAFSLDNTAGAALSVIRTSSIGSLAGGGATGGNVTLASGNTLTVGGLNTSTQYDGAIGGAGALTKTGSGALTFTGNNTFTGNVIINNGTLDITSGGLHRNTDGTAAFNGTAVVTINTGGTLKLNSFEYNGTGGTGGLADRRERRVLNGGTIEVSGTSHISGSDFTVNAAGGTFRYNPLNTANTLSLAGNGNTNIQLDGTVIYNALGNITVTEAMDGAGGLTKTGAGTLTFDSPSTGTGNAASANTYTGVTTISEGTLQLGDGTNGKDGIIASASIVNNANLSYNRFGSISYGGVISGGGTVTKTGAGTQTLTGANSYLGATNVNNGTLAINGDNSLATGAVTVASGATLAGNGTVGGTTTIQSGGIHGPGNSPGVQTFSSDLNYTAGSIFSWDLASLNTAGRGTNFDGVNVGGALNINPTAGTGAIFRVVLGTVGSQDDNFWTSNQTWSQIFNVTGTQTGAFNTFQVVDSSSNPVAIAQPGSFSYDNTSGSLTWSAVPEPTSALAALLLGAGLLRRRRVA